MHDGRTWLRLYNLNSLPTARAITAVGLNCRVVDVVTAPAKNRNFAVDATNRRISLFVDFVGDKVVAAIPARANVGDGVVADRRPFMDAFVMGPENVFWTVREKV